MVDGGKRKTGRPSTARAAEIGPIIVRATIDTIVEHGTDFRMDQVAATAGISKQAIYRRWPGKVELVLHAIDHHLEEQLDMAGTDLPDDPCEALHEAAWRLFNAQGAIAISRMSLMLQVEALRSPVVNARLSAWRTSLMNFMIDRIVAATNGKIDCASATELAELLQEMFAGIRNRLYWMNLPADAGRKMFESRWRLFTRLLVA